MTMVHIAEPSGLECGVFGPNQQLSLSNSNIINFSMIPVGEELTFLH